ncbi:MAG: P1 family peptidase [Tissierellia bacterium]|nr:P1 family peptidase [Tissierellia bacterium]
MKEILFTDIEGIKVGHAQDLEAGTGCTVIICEEGAVAGVDVRGGSPGTRETDLLNPQNQVDRIHAVLLTGGSAFGLDAASGVMKYLEERDIGFDVQVTKVPIVCGAVLFDLVVGDYRVRPNLEMGYRACANARDDYIERGNVGAGTGASVGKFLGIGRAMKGGLGSFGYQVGDLKVAAIVAVNALGDIIDPDTGELLAGLLDEKGERLIGTERVMAELYQEKRNVFRGNTTIGVIATNGIFTKGEANKLASMAHNGYARAIRPAHTIFDGDTIFTMATARVKADINVVGFLAARAMERAIVDAIKSAHSAYGLKSYRDLISNK